MSVRGWLCVAMLGGPSIAGAQGLPIPIPKVLIFPNYDNVLVGKAPALEGGAFVARASDSAANFYNAAGLVNGDRTTINASSNGYVVTQIGSTTLGESFSGTNIDNLPGFIGVLFGAPFIDNRNLRFGFAVTRLTSWAPPGIDESTSRNQGDAFTRVTYSSTAAFRTLLYQGAAAWAPDASRSVRLGLILGLGQTILDARTTLSGQLPTASGPALFLSSIRASGTEWDLLTGVSAQWDILTGLTLGARWNAPGVKIGTSSLLTYEANLLTPAAPSSSFFRDDEGAFRYKHPWEASVGLAYRFGPAQVEADVRYHDSVDEYDLYRTDVPIETVVQNPNGTTSSSSSAGPLLVYQARRVTNVEVGGNWRASRILTVHAGFYTAFSPVENAVTSPLREADLYGVTGGVDFVLGRVGLSVGAGYEFGTSSPTGLSFNNATVAASDLSLKAISFLYSFSYQF